MSSSNIGANKIVELDIGKMLSISDSSTNVIVGYMTIKPDNYVGYIVACGIVNGIRRLPRISDLDHFGPGDFRRCAVISDSDFGRCAVKSDGDFGRCAVNSDAAVNSDGDLGRCAVNADA